MEFSRLEDASLFLYLQNEVLMSGFLELRESDEVSLVSSGIYQINPDTSILPNPFGRGRGIPYYDEIVVAGYGPVADKSAEQTSRVTLYDSGMSALNPADYSVDYKSGKVYTNTVVPTSADYYYHYVSVVDSNVYLDEAQRLIEPPFVVIESSGQDRIKGLELGGGKIIPRTVTVYVYATNVSERDDITQVLVDGLEQKSIKVTDFNNTNGPPLNYNGTFNTAFVEADVDRHSCIQFEEVTYKNMNRFRDVTVSQLNRSVITFKSIVHVEGRSS